jgi:hypothetical protein
VKIAIIHDKQKTKNQSFPVLEHGYMTDEWFDKELEK